MQRHWKLGIMLAALALAVLASCGGDDDDDADAGDEEPGSGEACTRPGFTETGCACKGGGVGHRTCQENKRWAECRCPPVSQQCVQGQTIECDLCPGETEKRMTKCLQGGTFDCACDRTQRDGG